MKIYILLVIALIGIALFFSCKEEDNNYSGVYDAVFVGEYSYKDSTYTYNKKFQLILIQKDKTNYSLYSAVDYIDVGTHIDYENTSSSENTKVQINSNNEINGDFYLYIENTFWTKGKLMARVDDNEIKGSFSGDNVIFERTIDTMFHTYCPIDKGSLKAIKK